MKLEVGAAENCGLREYMEDRFYFDLDFRHKGELFAGVYDGHGGDEVAQFLQKELHHRVLNHLGDGNSFLKAFVLAYEKIADEVCDLKLAEGSCAANLILSGGKIYFANAGDVRILVVGKDVRQLTIDHHPNVPEEKQRIIKSGGVIAKKHIISDSGYIAISRSIGDREYRFLGLIPTPHIGVYELQIDDLALVAASDGVFETMSNEKVAQITRNGQNAQAISQTIIQAALRSGSNDNVTALAVKLIK